VTTADDSKADRLRQRQATMAGQFSGAEEDDSQPRHGQQQKEKGERQKEKNSNPSRVIADRFNANAPTAVGRSGAGDGVGEGLRRAGRSPFAKRTAAAGAKKSWSSPEGRINSSFSRTGWARCFGQ